ncbi:MAG: hypothetical protein IJ375_02790 [Oscillospiraceae bacterium]|nr:hypothetical protein [Oscillospiraceae bacterium]
MAKKIIKLLFWATLVWAVVYIAQNIIASFVYFTSFPWWSAFVFAGCYFGPALILEGILWAVLVWLEKRKARHSEKL